MGNSKHRSAVILQRSKTAMEKEQNETRWAPEPSYVDDASAGRAQSRDPLFPLIRQFAQEDICYTPTLDYKPIIIARLPHEILLMILHYLALRSVSSLASFGLVCKPFYLLTRSPWLWQGICEQTFKARSMTWEVSRAYQKYMVQTFYANIWLRMFIDRPRVRYDGVYISVCQYTRTTNSFAPECLVTYYRYLRFFPNGAVLKYLSLEDPSKVVRLLVANFPDKHAFYGWFDMHDDTVSVTMRERTRPRVQYRMMLQIKNSHKRRHYKLAWKEYSNETEGREGHEEFDLKAFKPYYFSLVRCYVPESPCWDDTCIRK